MSCTSGWKGAVVGVLLNILYLMALLVTSPFLAYQSIRYGKYREGFAAKFLGNVPVRKPASDGTYRRCFWFHAVSVGEVVLIAPLIARLRQERPDDEIVLSTTSRTGQAVAKSRYPDLMVFYAPLDFTWAVRRAMRRIRPDVLVLVELEVWPNLIREAVRSGVRVAIVNGRLSEHSADGYRRFRRVLRPIFAAFDRVMAQDVASADRFRSLGVPDERLLVTGSLKYEGAQTDREFPPTVRLRKLVGLTGRERVFVAGSTQPGEDEAAIRIFSRMITDYPELRLILVPRHPQRFDAVWRLCEESGFDVVRRSQIGEASGNSDFVCEISESAPEIPDSARASHETPSCPPWRILLVDTVGELSAWWGVAEIAFVGGSFGGRGGQNMIEPAGFGAAVCFGPDTRNFREIVTTLLADDAATVVRDTEALEKFVRQCLEDPDFARAMGARAQQKIRSCQGAVRITTQILTDL
ncbi:MAG: 3-deoxy-D-manno-octulosonic acid transferase, partial [Planctomycetia bacterium]|nr:3-deoxy-D-manno-octulosonic acid transferase [Planctomycetia bacterium]